MYNELSAKMHMYVQLKEGETQDEGKNRLEKALKDLESQGISFQIYETEIQ